MSSKMLIDASHPEETRVVVAKGNRLEDFDFESQHKHQIRGNIYLAKITRVEPSLQAAFVDYGGNRHGFLAFSEIHPDYYQIPQADRQALIEEEAAQVNADFDYEDEEVDAKATNDEDDNEDNDKSDRRGRGKRRGGKGRGRRGDRDKSSNNSASDIPDAEPVAMEAILAAHEANFHADGVDAIGGTTLAAEIDNDDVVSEALNQALDVDAESDDDDDDDAPEVVEPDDAIEESRPRRRVSRRNYKIQEVIKRRQIILVQVVKEERGNKGAALTTYLSLAGRYSVLMPNTARGGGISRKITNAPDRKRLKAVVRGLDVPKGMGVILRTAGANRVTADIHRDYEYLMRLWNNVRDLTLRSSAPTLVYEEGSLIKRSIRDLYNKDIDEVIVAGADGYREAKEFMRMLMPSHAKLVQPWRDPQPILAKTGIESQLDKLIQPQVTLKSGGYIIINQTEALVAIDVNSGKSTREHSIENTALATNLEAAEEVARQLRLRDLAGLIVIDFIDMEENRNNRAVEKKLKECLKADRARIQIGRISHFGLMEMSRQRMRSSVLESTMAECPHCAGTGYIRSPQSIALHIIRSVEEYLLRNNRNHITVRTTTESALYLLNKKRETLVMLENRFGLSITVEADNEVGTEMFAITKGDVSDWDADPEADAPISVDDFDDPEQLEADEEAYKAFLEDEKRNAKSRKQEEAELADDTDDSDDDEDTEDGGNSRSGRRRNRKGRGKRGGRSSSSEDNTSDAGSDDSDEGDDSEATSDGNDESGRGRSKRRRRSRGRRGGRNRRDRSNMVPDAEPVGPLADLIAEEAKQVSTDDTQSASDGAEANGGEQAPKDDNQERGRKRRRRGGKRNRDDNNAENAQSDNDNVNEPVDLASAPQPDVNPQAEPEPVKQPDVAEVAAETVQPVKVEEAVAEDTGAAGDEKKTRVRATASSLNLDVEPVVSSSAETVKEKPKRFGWWSRK